MSRHTFWLRMELEARHFRVRHRNFPESCVDRRKCSPPSPHKRAGAMQPVAWKKWGKKYLKKAVHVHHAGAHLSVSELRKQLTRLSSFSGFWEGDVVMWRLHLSVGTAVQARLWDVPAVICWMDTPSRPWTFLGLVIGVDVWPCPHWPIVLFPQAYTSFSGNERRIRQHEETSVCFYNWDPSWQQQVFGVILYHGKEPDSGCLHTRYQWSWWHSDPLWTWVSERSSLKNHSLNRSRSPRQTPGRTMYIKERWYQFNNWWTDKHIINRESRISSWFVIFKLTFFDNQLIWNLIHSVLNKPWSFHLCRLRD